LLPVCCLPPPARLAGHLGADRPLATLTVGELEVAVLPVGTAEPLTCDLCRVNESAQAHGASQDLSPHC